MKRLVVACSLIVLAFAPGAAAQVPPTPDVPAPEVPPEVLGAVNDANAQLKPVLLQGAATVQPGVNAGGVALRPACVHASTIALAFGLGGVPLEPNIVTTPYTAFCKGAMKAGPADPVVQQVDGAAGPTLQSSIEPALETANQQIEPNRENLAAACLVLSLVGPAGLPPPISRINPTYELCWR